jgi:C4-dicarboxylate-specific signal transduction histidine kinase
MGLAILADMVNDAGGMLTVEPGAEAGTVVRVEVQTP